MRIGGLAIGYDLGRKGRRLSFAPACVDVVRWEYNKKCIVMSCSLPALVSSRPRRWRSRVTGRIVLVQEYSS